MIERRRLQREDGSLPNEELFGLCRAVNAGPAFGRPAGTLLFVACSAERDEYGRWAAELTLDYREDGMSEAFGLPLTQIYVRKDFSPIADAALIPPDEDDADACVVVEG
jgi:hypothetical protein